VPPVLGVVAVVGEVRLEDAGRRLREEVLVDDRPRGDPAPGDEGLRGQRRRRAVPRPVRDHVVREARQAGAGELGLRRREVLPPQLGAPDARSAGGTAASRSVSSSWSARPAAVRAMPRDSTSPKRTRRSTVAMVPSASRNRRGSASARNEVWRSSRSGPVPPRRPLDGVDHRDAARLHARVELVDVEHARRQVVDVRRPHAPDVRGDARDAGELAVPRAVHRLVRHREGRRREREEPPGPVRRQPVVLLGLPREGEQLGREDPPVGEVRLEAALQTGVEEPAVRGREQGGEHPERVAGQLARLHRAEGGRHDRDRDRPGVAQVVEADGPHAHRGEHLRGLGQLPRRRQADRAVPLGGDARDRPQPLRVGPSLRATSALTSAATSTSVVYAGTSRPYISDSASANRDRSSQRATGSALISSPGPRPRAGTVDRPPAGVIPVPDGGRPGPHPAGVWRSPRGSRMVGLWSGSPTVAAPGA
jgi:hypothetical protein